MSTKRAQILTNFPGLEYLTRVTTAWNEFLLGQAGTTQTLWEEVKNGKLDVKHVAQQWANAMEGYYDVALEATRTNADATRPAWLHIPFSGANPSTLQHPVTLSRSQPDGTTLAPTPFFRMGGQEKFDKLYSKTTKLSGPRTLLVMLEKAEVATLTAGEYMSVVNVSGRGAEPPLAVILLTVTA